MGLYLHTICNVLHPHTILTFLRIVLALSISFTIKMTNDFDDL